MVTSVDGVLPEEEEFSQPKFSSQAGLASWSGAQVPVSETQFPGTSVEELRKDSPFFRVNERWHRERDTIGGEFEGMSFGQWLELNLVPEPDDDPDDSVLDPHNREGFFE